ncbi:MAG TPA: hypothetical protein VGF69_19390 [Thermoanaerobaculia bacterium]|jgi:hypothetical protein
MQANSNPVPKAPSRRRPELFALLGAFWFTALAAPVCFAQNATAPKPQGVPLDVRSAASVTDRRVPATPAGVLDIVVIQPFRLRAGYHFNWLQSRPFVTEGLLVVLRVDPSHVVPRDAAERILYAGGGTVQRLNHGNGSGYVIGIIPGDVDLASEPIWFGRPGLPGHVTPEIIEAERTLAESAGIKPFSPDRIAAARLEPIEVEDLAALLRGPAADFVLKFSPDEKYLAERWRLPILGSVRPR